MNKLTWEEFNKCQSFIYCKDEEDLEKMNEWFIKNGNANNNRDITFIGDKVSCISGDNSLARLISVERHYRAVLDVYTVDQLEW